jgi:hypothetical protein
MNVACEEILRLLSCLFESGQRAGRRDDLAEREKRLFADLLHLNDSFVGFEFLPSRHRRERCIKSKCPSSGGWRLDVRAVKGAGFAFIGAKRRPLTEQAGG